eukprot:TRINITY_DN16690_c0_g1_i4.p2 TRINITY_DN16690_c0_g1~~TRINITY_DN16690_c0_g1_i4.p2  ORF type:complete len:250 (+),score=65.38 TRINITY_DN16690_c0_g1_i4:114-752(+)
MSDRQHVDASLGSTAAEAVEEAAEPKTAAGAKVQETRSSVDILFSLAQAGVTDSAEVESAGRDAQVAATDTMSDRQHVDASLGSTAAEAVEEAAEPKTAAGAKVHATRASFASLLSLGQEGVTDSAEVESAGRDAQVAATDTMSDRQHVDASLGSTAAETLEETAESKTAAGAKVQETRSSVDILFSLAQAGVTDSAEGLSFFGKSGGDRLC